MLLAFGVMMAALRSSCSSQGPDLPLAEDCGHAAALPWQG
jgi:hypothetical protein